MAVSQQRVGISFENPGLSAGDWEVKSCMSAAIVHRQVILLKKINISPVKHARKDGVKIVTIKPPAAL